MTIEDSYKHCLAVTRQRAKNFYFGIRLLPTHKRESLCAVYAFFRESDDLSDDPEIGNKAERLAHWRALVQERPTTLDGDAELILPAFYHSVDEFSIPPHYFEELLDGTTSDLTVTRYQSFEDLYDYCYKVASTVGLVCLHIFGFDGSKTAREQAEARGIAFQLTNILRDVKEDAERGRIYLPLEDLERFGLTEEQFLKGEKSEQMGAFLTYQIERAKRYYELSDSLATRVDPESRASLNAMTSIYRTLLSKIEEMGLEVFDRRARLSKMEKLALAGRTALTSLKGG